MARGNVDRHRDVQRIYPGGAKSLRSLGSPTPDLVELLEPAGYARWDPVGWPIGKRDLVQSSLRLHVRQDVLHLPDTDDSVAGTDRRTDRGSRRHAADSIQLWLEVPLLDRDLVPTEKTDGQPGVLH
jgi:hypothetical protein